MEEISDSLMSIFLQFRSMKVYKNDNEFEIVFFFFKAGFQSLYVLPPKALPGIQ